MSKNKFKSPLSLLAQVSALVSVSHKEPENKIDAESLYNSMLLRKSPSREFDTVFAPLIRSGKVCLDCWNSTILSPKDAKWTFCSDHTKGK